MRVDQSGAKLSLENSPELGPVTLTGWGSQVSLTTALALVIILGNRAQDFKYLSCGAVVKH